MEFSYAPIFGGEYPAPARTQVARWPPTWTCSLYKLQLGCYNSVYSCFWIPTSLDLFSTRDKIERKDTHDAMIFGELICKYRFRK